jgi:hypothetical protein
MFMMAVVTVRVLIVASVPQPPPALTWPLLIVSQMAIRSFLPVAV